METTLKIIFSIIRNLFGQVDFAFDFAFDFLILDDKY